MRIFVLTLPSSKTLKYGFLVISLGLIVIGIFQLILSLGYLAGTYHGAWYAGMLAMVLGLNGTIYSARFLKSGVKLQALRWLVFPSFFSFLCSLVGAIVNFLEYEVIKPLSSCASPSSSLSSSCFPNSSQNSSALYSCYGDSTYFIAALDCQVRANDVPQPVCSCVSATSTHCNSFVNVPSCDFLLHRYDFLLYWSSILALLSLIFSTIILFSVAIALHTFVPVAPSGSPSADLDYSNSVLPVHVIGNESLPFVAAKIELAPVYYAELATVSEPSATSDGDVNVVVATDCVEVKTTR